MATNDIDYRELVMEAHADEKILLREATRQMTDLIADLAFENFTLRRLYERELLSRIQGDATIERLRRLLHRQRAAA